MSDSNLLIEPLPPEWEDFQCGEVCDLVKDSHSPVELGETPYVGLEHLAQGFPAFRPLFTTHRPGCLAARAGLSLQDFREGIG
jgi:hypothetical protein